MKHHQILRYIRFIFVISVTLAQDNLDETIQSVFKTGSDTQRSVPPKTRGFAQIVTPEPYITPTSKPLTLTANNGQSCTCVPYHLCDPSTNKVRTESSDDDVIDGFGVIDIRFDGDTQSCQEVLDVCCVSDNTKEVPIVPVTVRPVNTPTGCGIRNVNGIDFTLSGNFNNEALYGEFPWTVAIIKVSDDTCVCGGSLIHPKVVLTGNHCVKEYINDPIELKVRAGEWDTQTTKERLPFQERSPSRIFSHPNYNARSLAYDIAIIELQDPFQLDLHINTVCLPPQNYQSTSPNCFASGWGKDVFGKPGKFSVIMKRVPLPIVPFNECQSALQRTKLTEKFRLDTSFICAGGQPGVDTCQGDGGAPLVCPVGNPAHNRYSQSGIVSWGIGCNEAHPAVYANVALARDWIDAQVRYVGLETSYYTY